MPLKKISLNTTAEHQKKRLDQVLAEWMPVVLKIPISKGKVRKLVIAGAVYLNGKRVRIASKEILPNAKIDVYVDLEKLFDDSAGQDIPFEMTEDRILYEDEFLIVVDKPSGVPTQPTLDEARINMFAAVSTFLDRRDPRTSSRYLGLHHRLDRDTSGVLLFTKSKEANPGIAKIFSTHQALKTYQALVCMTGAPGGVHNKSSEGSWTIQNYLGKLKTSGSKKSKFGGVRSGGDFAKTDFRVLERMKQGQDSVLWVEAKPQTGRTHQIRVHLSEHGMPILGDLFYGGRKAAGAVSAPRIMLHAAQLVFPHPISGKEIKIQSPLPEDFKKCLEAIRGKNAGS